MSKHQLGVIAGACLLIILFLFLPTTKTSQKEDSVKTPLTLDQRIDSAVSLVQGGSNPMLGIQNLLEIVKEDPKNIKVHLILADFAIYSQQYDKAIERFLVISKIDSTFALAYKGLYEVYLLKNENSNAQEALEKYNKYSNLPK